MESQRILIAGSTGNLGRALVEGGLGRGYRVRALARRPEALDGYRGSGGLEVVRAEVTRPEELVGSCRGIDTVISALGVTRQGGRVSFRDVDYQANLDLLREAIRAGVRKFVYTSGFGVGDSADNAMYRAKRDFELALMSSGIPFLIVRPSGFFSDMMMIFDMARQGRIYLLGPGVGRLNPIHLLDLADYYYLHLDDSDTVLEVGGPVTHSFNEIAEMAFAALHRPGRVTHISMAAVKTFLPLVRLFSFNTYTEVKAFAHIMVAGAEAPHFGRRTLEESFREAASEV